MKRHEKTLKGYGPEHAKDFRWGSKDGNIYDLVDMKPLHIFYSFRMCYNTLAQRYDLPTISKGYTETGGSCATETLAHCCMAFIYELENRGIYFETDIQEKYDKMKMKLLYSSKFEEDLWDYSTTKSANKKHSSSKYICDEVRSFLGMPCNAALLAIQAEEDDDFFAEDNPDWIHNERY